jgi:hypothetical protein
MTNDQLNALLAAASSATRRLNQAVADGGVRPAEPQRPVAEALDSGPQAQGKGQGRCVVRVHIRRQRLLDPDNAVGGIKALIDALRYHGHIVDDSPEHIELHVIQEKTHRKHVGTEVMITTALDEQETTNVT